MSGTEHTIHHHLNPTVLMRQHKAMAVVTVCFLCLSNLRILQKSTLSASASEEQWLEKPLCLGSASSCGSMLVGHILGFGEDELG